MLWRRKKRRKIPQLKHAQKYQGHHIRCWMPSGHIREHFVVLEHMPEFEAECKLRDIEYDILDENITLYLCDLNWKRWEEEGYVYDRLLSEHEIRIFFEDGVPLAIKGVGRLRRMGLLWNIGHVLWEEIRDYFKGYKEEEDDEEYTEEE